MQLLNIPAELRARPQWCACGPDKVPIDPKTRRVAAVDDPSTWGTFEQAVTAGFKHVGYMLSKDDPFAIIDLDNKVENPAPPEELERHVAIIEAFNTYTERSASGRGTHLILRGNVPKGVRRGHVELYSDLRFMICTGDIIKPLPIADRQEMVNNMYQQMEPTNFIDISEDQPEEYTDREIHERALAAENGEKYDLLTRNDQDWRDHYESQSEADNALIAMLTFYSKNNAQVKRLFHSGPLGQREKAFRPDYLDRSIRLARTRQAEREPPAVDFKLATEIANTVRASVRTHPDMLEDVFTIPTGLVGEITRHLLATAYQPNKEVCLSAALALLAGMAGRTYNTTTKSGLNLYMMVAARSGYGKEHMKRGLDRLINKVSNTVPTANEVIGPANFASGQAMIKVLAEHPCFVSILGEFGVTLQGWLDKRASSSTQLLVSFLMDAYGKSGMDDSIRPHVWADKEKNTKTIRSPNITILAESNPDEFFDALDVAQVKRGLVPRFLIIEPQGPPPDYNDANDIEPPATLVQNLADLMTTVTMSRHNNVSHVVRQSPDAMRALLAFRGVARERMLGDEFLGDIWNRAHLNALRIATLLAVGDNYRDPCVSLENAEWAIRVVEFCASQLHARFQRGDVGTSQRDQPLDAAIKWWLEATPKQRLDYKATKKTSETDVMPFNFFRNRLKRVAAYREDRRGVDTAIKAQLDTYCEIGYLRKLSREESVKMGSTIGGLYAIGPEFEG